MSFGLELPLDRDWSEDGQLRARVEGRPFGFPDQSRREIEDVLTDLANNVLPEFTNTTNATNTEMTS